MLSLRDQVDRRQTVLLAALVVLALAVRLPLLGRSVWFDEACMSDQRIGTFAQLVATIYVDIHPPLYLAFMHAWNALFGDGEWSLRTPPLLCGVAAIPLVFWTGRRCVGDRAALGAAALLAISPAHIWYSTEARLYAPMVACTLLAVGTFDRLLDRPRPQRGLLAVHLLNIAVMLALHYYLAVVVAALGALAPIAARGWSRTARSLLLWHGAGLALLAAFVLVKQRLGYFETSQDYLRRLTVAEFVQFVCDWCWTGNTLAPTGHPLALGAAWTQRALGAVLLGLGLAGLARAPADGRRPWLAAVGLFVLPLFLFACGLLGFRNTFIERSMLPALPFVLLLGARGLELLPRAVAAGAATATAGLAVAALVGLYANHEHHWTVYKPNADWRAAARWLGSEIDQTTGVRPVFTPTPNPRPLSYYDRRIQDPKSLALPTTPEDLGRRIGGALGPTIGRLAERIFRDLADHNAALLAGSRLRTHPTRPRAAELDTRSLANDGIAYLVRDHWHPHPSVDGSAEELLLDPRVERLAQQDFAGITVYKLRIEP